MSDNNRALVDAALVESIALHERARQEPQPILDAVSSIVGSLRHGGKLLLFGNGGIANVVDMIVVDAG